MKHGFLVNEFIKAARDMSLGLLKDDIQFVSDSLQQLPYDKRKEILQAYLNIWRKILGECECEISAQNLGRRTANRYLLEVCNGKVIRNS